MNSTTEPGRSFFPSPALDHAFAGIMSGVISTMFLNPLDLLKTRFQVSTSGLSSDPSTRSPFFQNIYKSRIKYALIGGKPGLDIADSLRDIVQRDGWRGLYRGIGPNVVGNASSWGLYYLCTYQLSAGEYLGAATTSGVVTAIMTNPIWVVKTRMFVTSSKERLLTPGISGSLSASNPGLVGTAALEKRPGTSPQIYRGLWHGLVTTVKTDGFLGLYKGVGLACIGVSNGAIQFMVYEKLKQWRRSAVLRRQGVSGPYSEAQLGAVALGNIDYSALSGSAKLVAILATYPYQVIRSRIQNHVTSGEYPSAWSCIVRTFREEGFRAFYRGLGPNALRILPGTCLTFVSYENISWALHRAAEKRVADKME
ncbi:mitochondrial FAD carrier protein flx1 [Malassezia cuniculi]|uniref:Mitochondrial FAD carrier protein flx1 n=1 Tax=Malassezia cuniculi TaxID=948313 RepID=A0AAF0EUG8_9BASI|nr:mitochondrial FAD carrier protein flx1 [Malassezia cuniculi]